MKQAREAPWKSGASAPRSAAFPSAAAFSPVDALKSKDDHRGLKPASIAYL